MDNKFEVKKKELKNKLLKATKKAERKRLARLINNPWKILYTRLKKATMSSKIIKAKTFWGGEMAIISPEIISTHIWKYGYFEADVCLYLIDNLNEGMTFVDIGGHFGFFSLLGSFLVGNEGCVLTFEPMPSTYKHLNINVSNYSKYPNIKTYNLAAYSDNLRIKFYDYGVEDSSYNSITKTRKIYDTEVIANEVVIPARKIDDVLKEEKVGHIDLIKIDVESSEIHVLEGLIETLKRDEPKIILEVGDRNITGVPESKELICYLQKINYIPYEIRNERLVLHSIQDRYEYSNLLFVHK